MTEQHLTLDVLKYALGPIQGLLNDEEVTDIMIYGPHAVWVRKTGKPLEKTTCEWSTAEELLTAAKAMGRVLKRRLNHENPILDTRLPDGSRVNAIIEPCYFNGACISIRLFPKKRLGIEDLLASGSINKIGVDVLSAVVRLGKNILISGGTGSGKTTLLNILAGLIEDNQIIVTVEDSRELNIGKSLWVPLESKKALNNEDQAVELKDLVKNALRMNPKWLVVGEVRGPEALDLVRAFNTGHAGLGTLHANSCYDALLALENLILQSGVDVSSRAVKEQVARAIHIVVQVTQFPDESRKIMEVAEVTGLNYDVSPAFPPYKIRTLYRFQFEGYSAKGKVQGKFITPDKPDFLKELEILRNYEIPECWRN